MRRPCSIIFLVLAWLALATSEEQITWTPNEDAENESLPLSMNQRQQLLKLNEAIRTSPDPDGTLQQVAEANEMSPQELVNMLDKNERDLAQNPSLARPTTIPSTIMKVLASLGVLISQSARKHPQSFTITCLTLLFLLYATITIPRTGMHVSRTTTLFSPNQKYLQKIADSPLLEKRPLGIQTKKTKWDDLMLTEDGVEIHKLPRKSELVQAVSAQLSLTPDALLEEFQTEDEDEKEEEDLDLKISILERLFDNAATVVSERQFTEYPSEKQPMKLASSNRQNHGVMLVPGLGSFGRYGLIHWQATLQLESDKDASVTLTTLKKMGIFDGQIHVQVQKYRSKILISAHLAVPKRGRKIRKAMAIKIVNELVESLGASATQRTRQSLARQSQGKRFKSGSHRRANERRKTRLDRETQIEEMSEDRRRKWQRGNPDAGRYRPSGDRQRSPNNR